MAAPLLHSQTGSGSKNFKSGNYKLSLIALTTRGWVWVGATLVSRIGEKVMLMMA